MDNVGNLRTPGVCLVFLLVFTLGSPLPSGAADGISLTALSDVVDERVFPWVSPAIADLGRELRATEAAVRAADPDISLATWAAYGSGFLRHVIRGRDLDCLVVFDLGTVPAAEATTRTLARVDTVVRAFWVRTQAEQRDPALVAWKMEGVDATGRLDNRDAAREILERALTSKTARMLSVRLPREDGAGLATVMPGREVPLPAMPDAKYLSNAVRYREAMPTAIRQLSVMIFFTVNVVHDDGSRRRWTLTPSLTWLGIPIPFEPLVHFVAFPDVRARSRFAELMDLSSDTIRTRLRLAADLLRTGRSVFERGSATKALKRMHQALEVMGPVFDPATRRRIDENIRRWLDAPAARELSDLEKVGVTMQEMGSNPALHALFKQSGTLADVASHWVQAVADMQPLFPKSADALAALATELKRLTAEDAGPERDAWGALAKQAAKLATETGPERGALEADFATLERPLRDAGWRFLPVVGADEGHVLVSRAHLGPAGVSGAVLARMCYGDFRFRLQPEEGTPVFRLPLRYVRGPAQERRVRWVRHRLRHADQRLRARILGARRTAPHPLCR